MNNGLIKKIGVLLAIGYWLLASAPVQAADVVGHFPTLLGSNGARAKNTDTVWLGELSDKEADSKQVDLDNDDGVVTDLHPCATSKATFLIHVAKPGKTSGTAYLNLWFDWNRDGQWSGGDTCAKEWPLQNFPIDLSNQTISIQPYTISFPAGKATDVWYRAIISLDQKITSEDGSGEFSVGEVEDYGPAPNFSSGNNINGRPRAPSKTRGLICYPSPLLIDHGQSIEFNVGTMPGWEKPASTGFSRNNPGLNGNGTSVHTSDKYITKKPKNPNSFGDPNNPFVYTSTHVHDIGALVVDPVTVAATYADGTTAEVVCTVLVWHPPKFPPPEHNPFYSGLNGLIDTGGKIIGFPTPEVKEKALPQEHEAVLSALKGGLDLAKKIGGDIFPPLKKLFAPQLPGQPPAPNTPTLNVFQRIVAWFEPKPGVGGGNVEKQYATGITATCKPVKIKHGESASLEITLASGKKDFGLGNDNPLSFSNPTDLKDSQRELVVSSTKDAKPGDYSGITYHSTAIDGPPHSTKETIKVNVFEYIKEDGWLGYTYGSVQASCEVIVDHDWPHTTPTPSPVPAPVPTPSSGDGTQKNLVPPPVPNTPTLNVFNIPPWVQFIPSRVIKSLGDAIGDAADKIRNIDIDPLRDLVSLGIKQPSLNIPKPSITEGGIISLQTFQIILPVPNIFTLPLPRGIGGPVIEVLSPLNFLSQRLMELSDILKKSVSPSPTGGSVPSAVSNPLLCIVKVSEDANQNNRFQYMAGCNGYKSCSFEIRSLTNIGNLVGLKTFDLPKTGVLNNYDYIPASAVVSTLKVTCDGNSYSANAHSSKAGSGTTFSPAGVGPEIKTGSSLDGGTVNSAYSKTLSALGGSLPYTWSVYSGALPTGLALSSGGVISGTPSAAATYNFTIQVAGGDGNKSSDKAFSIVVSAASSPLTITTTSPVDTCHITCQNPNPPAVPNAAASGGTSPYTWSLSGLDACATGNVLAITSGGVWSANVTSNCTGNGTLTVTDAVAATANLVFSMQMLTF